LNTHLIQSLSLVLGAVLSIAPASQAYATDQYQQQVTLIKPANDAKPATRCAVLLHGLARTSSSMSKLAEELVAHDYIAVNIDYPSRLFPIDVLAQNTVPAGIQACEVAGATDVYFVTHSLGGILLRAYSKQQAQFSIKRAVLLGPPNQGSEVVDRMRDLPGFQWLNGPAGQQLGTGSAGVPATLGALKFEGAVIAGTSSINPILSTYLPDPDDGKVSVASSRVDNMCAHMQIDVSHPYLMKDDTIIAEVLHFFEEGQFSSMHAEQLACSFQQ